MSQALDDLPLSFRRSTEFDLAGIVEERGVGLKLNCLVQFEEGFVHQFQVPQRMDHPNLLNF